MGATLGHSLGYLLGLDPAWLAMLGFVAVFAGASNTPLACMLMGLELFGGGSPIYFLLICVMAYLTSGHRSIYATRADSPTRGNQGNEGWSVKHQTSTSSKLTFDAPPLPQM